MKKLLLVCCTTWVFVNSNFAQADTSASEAVVAKIGTIEIKVSDVNKILESQNAETRSEIVKSPDLLDRLVRTEAIKRALLAEANAKNWSQREEVVQQVERAREQILVSSYMNSIAKPESNYPAEPEIKAAYETNKTSLIVPRQLHLLQIYLALPANGDKSLRDAVQRKAEDAVRKAQEKNANFSALARKISEHKDSAEKGGDMGWVTENQVIPEIRDAVSAMAKGEISKPIKTAQGWHILKLADIKAATIRPYEDVRDLLTQALRQKKATENEKQYLDALLAKTPININEIAIGQLRDTQPK